MSLDRPQAPATPELQVHVAADLDYQFRDVVSIYVGNGEVVLEFGNAHRSLPGHVTIHDRIVLTVASAYDLQQRLQQTLMDAQQKLQAQLQQRK
jgi:hypothetical protein